MEHKQQHTLSFPHTTDWTVLRSNREMLVMHKSKSYKYWTINIRHFHSNHICQFSTYEFKKFTIVVFTFINKSFFLKQLKFIAILIINNSQLFRLIEKINSYGWMTLFKLVCSLAIIYSYFKIWEPFPILVKFLHGIIPKQPKYLMGLKECE